MAAKACNPNGCDAVRGPEFRAIENRTQTWVLVRLPESVESGDCDSAATPVTSSDPALDVIHCASRRDKMDPRAEDSD